MKRLVRPLLIAITISIVVTVVLFFVAGFMGGACHCMTPVSVLFPYGTFVTMRTSYEATGFYLGLGQFPLYAIVITLARRRWLAAALVLIIHSIAAAGALTMYRWW
jgi:hypothetical protein